MRKAIVIGATSGIGKETAHFLVKKGYQVGIVGRRTELLDSLSSEQPNSYISKHLDITELEKIVPALEEMSQKLGGLDVLIISAGILQYNADLDYSIEDKTINTNIKGFTCIADWGFNYFKNQNRGQLIGISSVAGFRGWRNNPAYNASKSYQMNYLEGLRSLANHFKLNITVTDFRPGYVDTAMIGKTFVLWVATPAKVAKAIYAAIKYKKKIVYVSLKWRFGAWLYKSLPNRLIENV